MRVPRSIRQPRSFDAASLGDNLAFERTLNAGDVDQALANPEVVEADFVFARHTGVTLEPRAVVADWNAAERHGSTIYQGTQAPHMVQNIAALHLGLK